ncbi:MAG: hypothetical protein KW793_00055 [Candidatus Doudnabacteria bacterium]|nr:hypothetical protein [Candidatus Doudnabacteria bacterium]
MEAQDFFYAVATIALVLFSVFIGFFFYVLYKLNRLAKNGFQSLSFAARDIQNSFGTLAKSWGRATLIGLIAKAIRSFITRR